MTQTPTRITFAKTIGFRKELNKRVDAYFEANQLQPRDNLAIYVKIAIVLVWVISAATFTLFGPPILWIKLLGCVFLGLSLAAVGFNIGHDANHGSCSNKKWVNNVLGLSFDLIGLSSYVWRIRHNFLHHTFTNILEYDVEIQGDGLVRMSPHADREWYHQFQHLFVYLIYPIIPIYWSITDIHQILFKRQYSDHVITPKPREIFFFLACKLIWIGLFIGLPIAVGYSPLEAFVGFAISHLTYGLIICIIVMLAHVMDTAEFIEPNPQSKHIDDEWAIFQVKTTVDFAPNNHLLTWYVGGLNYQVIHHLFPQVHHIHYPKIAPIIAEVCEEYGLKYKVCPTFREALAANYRWLKTMGYAS